VRFKLRKGPGRLTKKSVFGKEKAMRISDNIKDV
jgi:hypothetical protein